MKFLRLLVVFITGFLFSLAQAQTDFNPLIDWQKRQAEMGDLQSYGSNTIADSVDPNIESLGMNTKISVDT